MEGHRKYSSVVNVKRSISMSRFSSKSPVEPNKTLPVATLLYCSTAGERHAMTLYSPEALCTYLQSPLEKKTGCFFNIIYNTRSRRGCLSVSVGVSQSRHLGLAIANLLPDCWLPGWFSNCKCRYTDNTVHSPAPHSPQRIVASVRSV